VSFRARPGLQGATVLVVDDVVTTGATLRSARAALAGVGAADVRLYAVASTPTGVTSALRPSQRHLQTVTDDVAA
jgi:hypoxanthine phosphoribosyltransferase